MDGVNRWRRSVDTTFSHPNRLTRDAVRYTVDRDLIGKVTTVCEASAAVFVLPLQSTWMKYSFGDGMQTRLPGDVGVDAYFADQTTLKITFDQAGNVTAINRTGVDQVVGISPWDKKTPTLGRESNFFRDLFGNIGTVGAPGTGGPAQNR